MKSNEDRIVEIGKMINDARDNDVWDGKAEVLNAIAIEKMMITGRECSGQIITHKDRKCMSMFPMTIADPRAAQKKMRKYIRDGKIDDETAASLIYHLDVHRYYNWDTGWADGWLYRIEVLEGKHPWVDKLINDLRAESLEELKEQDKEMAVT